MSAFTFADETVAAERPAMIPPAAEMSSPRLAGDREVSDDVSGIPNEMALTGHTETQVSH